MFSANKNNPEPLPIVLLVEINDDITSILGRKYYYDLSSEKAGKLNKKAGKLSEATQKARTCSTFTFPSLYYLLYIKSNQSMSRDPVSLPCLDISYFIEVKF